MPNKKFKKGLVVLILLIIAGVALSVASYVVPEIKAGKAAELTRGNPSMVSANMSNRKTRGSYMAVLYIEGTIQSEGDSYNQAWILSNIAELKKDPKNKAIILFIDSPGGTVYEADEVYLALQDYKTSGKKVYAYMGSLAASGGYYIACAANKIYANRNTLTGSIGVIAGQSLDLSEFLEDHGIRYETIHAGKNKIMGSINEPLNDEQREIMQTIADECYEQFTSIVAVSRNIPYSEVLPLCDGRIYTASQAVANGLIDGIEGWEQFLDRICEEDEDLADCKTSAYRYHKEKGFLESVLGVSGKAQAPAGLPENLWNQMNLSGPLYLYR